jgi:hypothetical protein
MGGLRSKFGPIRTASGPSRRVRERGLHEDVAAGRRAIFTDLREPRAPGPHVERRARGVQTRKKDHPSPSLRETSPGRRPAPRDTAAGSTTFTKIANKWNTALIGADSASSVILNFLWERRWRLVTASVPRRPHDVLPRGGREHAGDAGFIGAESASFLNLKLRRWRRCDASAP